VAAWHASQGIKVQWADAAALGQGRAVSSWRRKSWANIMDGTEWRVQSLGHVEIVGQSAWSHHPLAVIARKTLELGPPVLEPNLNLAGAQSRNLTSKAFSVSSIWMSLPGKFAHEEASLIVGQPRNDQKRKKEDQLEDSVVPESLHLALLSADFCRRHLLLLTFLRWIKIDVQAIEILAPWHI
jgi:hypothetical protein